MDRQGFLAPNETGPTEVVCIDEDLCIACNACANICRTQTILRNPVSGEPPLLVYPDECWFCACCVEACPTGALEMRQPIGRRILFKRKETGEVFRVGQNDAPAKSFFRPPYGELIEDDTWKVWITLNKEGCRSIAILPRKTCSEVAEKFRWEDIPEKIISLLKNIGFDMVFEKLPEEWVKMQDDFIVSFSSDEPVANGSTLRMRTTDLLSIIKRACVSMYTAVHIWEELPLCDFDIS